LPSRPNVESDLKDLGLPRRRRVTKHHVLGSPTAPCTAAYLGNCPVGTLKKKATATAPSFPRHVRVGQCYSLLCYEPDKAFSSAASLEARAWSGAVYRQFQPAFQHRPRSGRLSGHRGRAALSYHGRQPISLLWRRLRRPPAVSRAQEPANQIEYEYHYPRIHPHLARDMRNNGSPPNMEKFVPTPR